MTVSVVVPTYHRPDALRKTLEALTEVDYPADSLEIVVVDDGADDTSRAVVQEFEAEAPPVTYISQDHAGVAAARNRGAAAASGELLIFLDDDMIVGKDHIRRHVEDQARFGDAMVNGHWGFAPALAAELESSPFGRFRIELEEWVQDGIEKQEISADLLRPAGVTACNLGIRSETFERLGGFDETFPYAGCEDQDLSLRADGAGVPFVYDRAIDLLHDDRRLSLREFGERQRRGATTHVFLAARHAAVREQSDMLRENGPLRRGEPIKVSAKKIVKHMLARPAGFALLGLLARVLETVAPGSRALRRLYWSTLGVYIYAGIRDGLRSDRRSLRSEVPEPAS